MSQPPAPSSLAPLRRSGGRFIPRILWRAGLLLLVYGVAAPRLFPGGGEAQNRWQDNLARTERYVQRCDACRVVIVGSSMAVRLTPEEAGGDFCNLALIGHGALTGLELIERCAHPPELVLMEADETALLPADRDLLHRLEQPLMRRLRAHVAILNESFQPVSLLFQGLRELSGSKEEDDDVRLAPERTRQLIDRRRAVLQELPEDLADTTRALQQLEAVTGGFLRRGIRVALFEVPVEPEIEETPRPNFIRAQFRARFTDAAYVWVPRPQPNDYATTDGMHLNAPGAKRFARVLQEQANKILAPSRRDAEA